ncbi:MAG: hypothetical protein ABI721_02755 [Candidatus Dojkabacteria bacterium]
MPEVPIDYESLKIDFLKEMEAMIGGKKQVVFVLDDETSNIIDLAVSFKIPYVAKIILTHAQVQKYEAYLGDLIEEWVRSIPDDTKVLLMLDRNLDCFTRTIKGDKIANIILQNPRDNIIVQLWSSQYNDLDPQYTNIKSENILRKPIDMFAFADFLTREFPVLTEA